MIRIKSALVFLALPVLAGCSAVSVLNGITPSSSFERTHSVAYGEGDRAVMDIYRTTTPKEAAPTLVFVHGGSWSEGSKDIYKFLAEGFTKDGYNVVVPNYRLFPEARYPDMIADTGASIRAAREMFPNRPVVLIGHSAGGYNALMAVMAPELSGLDVCASIAGVVSLAAPTGAYPLKEEPFITIFPDRFTGQDAPMGRVDSVSGLPPFFLINGLDDTTVGPKNAEDLAVALQARGFEAKTGLYDGMDHTDVVRLLSRHFDGDSSLKDDILGFIDPLSKKSGSYCSRAD